MKANNHQPAPYLQDVECLLQRCLKALQFLIHGDAKRLKGFGSGVNPAPYVHSTCHCGGKLKRGVEGAICHNRPRYLATSTLLAIPFNNAGKLLLREGIDDGGCGKLLRGVEAHIERGFMPKAEAPFRVIELKR